MQAKRAVPSRTELDRQTKPKFDSHVGTRTNRGLARVCVDATDDIISLEAPIVSAAVSGSTRKSTR